MIISFTISCDKIPDGLYYGFKFWWLITRLWKTHGKYRPASTKVTNIHPDAGPAATWVRFASMKTHFAHRKVHDEISNLWEVSNMKLCEIISVYLQCFWTFSVHLIHYHANNDNCNHFGHGHVRARGARSVDLHLRTQSSDAGRSTILRGWLGIWKFQLCLG